MDDKSEQPGREPDEEPSTPAPPDAGVASGDAAPEGAAETHLRDDDSSAQESSDGEQSSADSKVDAETGKPEESRGGRYVIDARYGALPVSGTATVTDPTIPRSAPCIIKTKRGTEMGMTLSAARPVEGDMGETIGHVLRRTTERDLERQRKIESEQEPDELNYCRQKIRERGLRMRLSAVEHIWGGERIVYCFTAERRVDFRALVRDLAWHFHTRIELRQIGARDEARLLADYEHCGQPLCCKTFLRSLEPVTMRMAKLQRTTLDPSKISGRCGRLMCCLRFEDEVYRELKKGLPIRGTRVMVGPDEGMVASAEILTQEVSVRLMDGRMVKAPASELRPPPPASEATAETAKVAEATTPARPAGSNRGRVASSAPAEKAEKGQPAKPGEQTSSDGGGRRTRRRGRTQATRKAPVATSGSPPSVRTKPARSRKGRRRGGKASRGRPGGGGQGSGNQGGGGQGDRSQGDRSQGGKGQGGGGPAGGKPSGEPRKDVRPGGDL